MPVYEFKTPANTIVECFFPVSKAPDIGAQVDIDGITCTRIISTQVGGFVPIDDNPTVCAAGNDEPGHFEQTKSGHAILKNKHDRRDYLKANPDMVPAREVNSPEPFNDYTDRVKQQADAIISANPRKGKP